MRDHTHLPAFRATTRATTSTLLDANGRLNWIAAAGNLPKVIERLRANANINVRDEYGNTALLVATIRQNDEVFDELLSRGADVNVVTTGPQQLADDGTRIEDAKRIGGNTPLLAASSNGNLRMVQELLMRGARVNHRADLTGGTALHAAAWRGYTDIVRELLAHGAHVNARDKRDKTALHYARQGRRTEVIKLLSEHVESPPPPPATTTPPPANTQRKRSLDEL